MEANGIDSNYRRCYKALMKGDVTSAIDILRGLDIKLRSRVLLYQPKDMNGYNLLHMAALKATQHTSLLYDCVLNEWLSQKELLQIMKSVTSLRRTPLHMSAWSSDVLCLKLVEKLKSLYSDYKKEVREILLARNSKGRTFFHWTAIYRSWTVNMSILNPDLQMGLIKELISAQNSAGQTALHWAVYNAEHPDVIKLLLEFILGNYKSAEARCELLMVDHVGRSFLHWAASDESPDVMKNIITTLPRDIAGDLYRLKDSSGKTACDLTKFGLTRDWLNQSGSYPIDFYLLPRPPKVMVFYSTYERVGLNSAEMGISDAEAEKVCIERSFKERNIPCAIHINPTASDVFSFIEEALSEEDLTALVVFVMCHGFQGILQLNENEEIMIESVESCMTKTHADKPKVLIVQACQVKRESCPDGTQLLQHDLRNDQSGLDGPVPTKVLIRQAEIKGANIKSNHFLLFMAALDGQSAIRNLMIPCLMDSLRQLTASDDLHDAILSTQLKIEKELKAKWPERQQKHIPVVHSTLKKKLCLGKMFPVSCKKILIAEMASGSPST